MLGLADVIRLAESIWEEQVDKFLKLNATTLVGYGQARYTACSVQEVIWIQEHYKSFDVTVEEEDEFDENDITLVFFNRREVIKTLPLSCKRKRFEEE